MNFTAKLIFTSLLTFSLILPPAWSEETQNPNRPIKDKWAVLIGISKFADPDIPRLKYPAKDAKDFCDFLVKNGNFKRDHILLLTDEQANKERILETFGDGWLPRRVMADDLVLIFISSHGSPADRAGENFIIAYDSDPKRPYATSIRLQDLASEVGKRTGCDRLLLLLDACHSGAAVDGQKGLTRSMSNFDLSAITGTGQLIISSSKPDEVSWESKRYPNGVFTHNLIDALQSNGSQTKIEEAYKKLKDNVATEVRFDRIASQTPMMLDKWNGEGLALCAPPAEPRVVPLDPEETINKTKSADSSLQGSDKVKTVSKASPATKLTTTASLNSQTSNNTAGESNTATGVSFMKTCWTENGGDPTLEKGSRLIQESELKGLSKAQLTYMYNEAYARHGRGFATADIQNHFNRQSWYRQDPDYHWKANDPRVQSRGPDDSLVVNAKRTPIQWANMQTLKRAMQSVE
ncbi:MAG: caspase family protein [Candidatus Obscuribacterales bacterium]|nr:caspase family protein [Candidatus Obscuribacterales bacterium]